MCKETVCKGYYVVEPFRAGLNMALDHGNDTFLVRPFAPLCPIGRYKDVAAAIVELAWDEPCKACPAGQHTDTTGTQDSCTACPKGQ